MHRFADDVVDLPTDLALPRLAPDVEALRAHFRAPVGERPPLRNPHHETPVDAARRAAATPAAVLLPILHGGDGPLELLLTRRHAKISFGGHLCFPGGRRDPGDRDTLATALREAREEIALPAERVEVLGALGPYVTQTGFEIAPWVALVERPVALRPSDGEVDEILTVPLHHALDEGSYRLVQTRATAPRAHYVLTDVLPDVPTDVLTDVLTDALPDVLPDAAAGGERHVTGPTVSLVIGLYEALAGR